MLRYQARENYNSIFFVSLFTLVLVVAVVVMTAATLGFLNQGYVFINNMLSGNQVQDFIHDAIPMEEIQGLIRNSFSPDEFNALAMGLVNNPAFQVQLQLAIAGVFQSFGVGSKRAEEEEYGNEKRFGAVCTGISDPSLCGRTGDMCYHMHRCADKFNITECQIVGGLAYRLCYDLGF
jgi:hypothetical protein